MFAKLLTWLKMFFAYRAGESSQETTDHNQAVDTANTIGQKIVNAQSTESGNTNADLARELHDQGL